MMPWYAQEVIWKIIWLGVYCVLIFILKTKWYASEVKNRRIHLGRYVSLSNNLKLDILTNILSNLFEYQNNYLRNLNRSLIYW